MASEAQILSAAREVAMALAAFNEAKAERVKSAREDEIALAKCNACQIRHQEAERRLMDLARQKPEPVAVRGPAPIPFAEPKRPDYIPDSGLPRDSVPAPAPPANHTANAHRKREKV